MTGLNETLSFHTFSMRPILFDLLAVNREIASLFAIESIAAIDSFMIYTCRYSAAVKRKIRKSYTDSESG